ncbi:MAG: DUF4274 domain-containing protein, partial [Myxococcota bacterium]
LGGTLVRSDELSRGREAELHVQVEGAMTEDKGQLWLEPLILDDHRYVVSWVCDLHFAHLQVRLIESGDLLLEAAERAVVLCGGVLWSETLDPVRLVARKVETGEALGGALAPPEGRSWRVAGGFADGQVVMVERDATDVDGAYSIVCLRATADGVVEAWRRPVVGQIMSAKAQGDTFWMLVHRGRQIECEGGTAAGEIYSPVKTSWLAGSGAPSTPTQAGIAWVDGPHVLLCGRRGLALFDMRDPSKKRWGIKLHLKPLYEAVHAPSGGLSEAAIATSTGLIAVRGREFLDRDSSRPDRLEVYDASKEWPLRDGVSLASLPYDPNDGLPVLDILDLEACGGVEVEERPGYMTSPRRLVLRHEPPEPVFRVQGYPWVVLCTEAGRADLRASSKTPPKFFPLDPLPQVPGTLDPWCLHRKLSRHNWDLGLPNEIVRSPTCDLATLQLAYWNGSPGYYLKFRTKSSLSSDSEREGYSFLSGLERRVKRGDFLRGFIAHDPAPNGDPREYGKRVEGWVRLPPDLLCEATGPSTGDRAEASQPDDRREGLDD